MSESTSSPTTRRSREYRTRRGFDAAVARLSASKSSALLHDLSTGEYVFITDMGMPLGHTHAPENCEGRHCVVHNPSDHAMRDFPTHWRWDRRIMERICPHGVGHPDPDDLAFRIEYMKENDGYAGVHGCDGCCG